MTAEELKATIAEVLAESDAWIVGGAIRDELLGRTTYDFDLAIVGDVGAAARNLAKKLDAFSFELSDEFRTWRISDRKGEWQVDVSHIRGDSIEADLVLRDFTVNAMAVPVQGGDVIDPSGGRKDLESKSLRAVSDNSFVEDPLRTLRLVRGACELGFHYDEATASLAQKSAEMLQDVAGERVFTELKRIISSDRSVAGIRMLDELGLLAVVLPEIADLKGVEQSEYHHLDVFDHTLEVLAAVVELESDPTSLGSFGETTVQRLEEPLSDELTRWQALRLAALFHDCAKPQTRAVDEDGRITFHGHDEAGAQLAKAAMKRLRSSQRLANYVADIARHHLTMTFRVPETPTDRELYAFLRDTDPVEVDAIVISVADRIATRGRNYEQATEKQLALAATVLPRALDWSTRDRTPLVRGDLLATDLDLEEGPLLGALIRELDAARYCGEIATPTDAVEYARTWLASR